MSVYCDVGGLETNITSLRLAELIVESLEKLGRRKKVLAVPPDLTRVHSRAGEITRYAWHYYRDSLKAVLPALGTHTAMSPDQISQMYSGIPLELFLAHNWRSGIETLGEVPSEYIVEQSEGKLHYSWPAQVNEHLTRFGFDLVLSIGQVVPHEVIGMANYNKNILIGIGGREGINRSHYLGAVYGMERILGRPINPVRQVLNYASDRFLCDIPIVYILTVLGRKQNGGLALRGLYIGDDIECFQLAADLSQKVNIEMIESPIRKAVVYLDPHEFHSTWLGNKAIYRTRMALADDAELIVLAPGVREFGEDKAVDRLIRRYGYWGTPATMLAVESDPELANNLSAAAHLIHGSSEDRFRITYCPGRLSREEIESVGYRYGELPKIMRGYDPVKLSHGYNKVDGEEIFFIGNPGLGLWAHQSRFDERIDQDKSTGRPESQVAADGRGRS